MTARQIICPDCFAEAVYKYGRTVSGQQKYICQVCGRQFILKEGRVSATHRPVCPNCFKNMHVYMRGKGFIRFRCANYPYCRTFRKVESRRVYLPT